MDEKWVKLNYSYGNYKSNLVYTVVFPQFLIFQQNNSAQTSVLIFFTSQNYYFVEKLKIVKKQLCKLNYSYGKVLYTLKTQLTKPEHEVRGPKKSEREALDENMRAKRADFLI